MKSGSQPETRLRNLDRRVDRVEQILPMLATKVDMKAFATKEDLKAFATKDDLKAFPTREEMREAIQEAVGQVLVLFEAQTHEIRRMAETLNTHLHRHGTLERRVESHAVSLDALDLRARRLETPRRRRTT